MQGPDGVDRVQYLPPDRVLHTQHADPDKKQKFSRALEEEEEELEKRRKRRPHDQVELETEVASDNPGTAPDSTDEDTATPTEVAESADETNEEPKHVDVKA